MTKGGARYTHTTLLAATLDYIAMEAQIAQEELLDGRLTAVEAAWRFRRFSAEVEKLAREGVRHLRLIQPSAPPAVAAVFAEELAA